MGACTSCYIIPANPHTQSAEMKLNTVSNLFKASFTINYLVQQNIAGSDISNQVLKVINSRFDSSTNRFNCEVNVEYKDTGIRGIVIDIRLIILIPINEGTEKKKYVANIEYSNGDNLLLNATEGMFIDMFKNIKYSIKIEIDKTLVYAFDVWLCPPAKTSSVRSDISGDFSAAINSNSSSQLMFTNKANSTRINIRAATDFFTGANLDQVLFGLLEDQKVTKYLQYPNLVKVVKGTECTLAGKSIFLADKEGSNLWKLFSGIILYGMLRYFLWFLITNNWDLNILLRRNTVDFFKALSNSQYSEFIEAFLDPAIRGFGKYFKK